MTLAAFRLRGGRDALPPNRYVGAGSFSFM